jgi:hypothetical protein
MIECNLQVSILASVFIRPVRNIRWVYCLDEISVFLNRKLPELENSSWNVAGTVVCRELDALRDACMELRNELFASKSFLQSLFTRLGELKLTPHQEFCSIDGIKPSWAEIDKVRVKQPLTAISRNFVTYMSCKRLPINNDVFRFLQSPTEYANTLAIVNKSFVAGELQAIMDFFVLASHPMVYGRSNRNTMARSVAKSTYRDNDDASDISAEKNNKLLHSVHSLQIINCSLQDRDCNALALRLALFSNLHTLCLCDNLLTSSGATAVAMALWSSPMQIKILALQNNRIGVDGALSLAKVLPRCKQLISLGLSGNPIGDIGAYFILKSLLNKFRKAYSGMPRPLSLVGSEHEYATDDDEDVDVKDSDEDPDLLVGMEQMSVTTPTLTSIGSSVSDSMTSIKEKERQREREKLKKRALMAKTSNPNAVDEDEDDVFSISETSVYSDGSHIPRKPPNFKAIILEQTALALYGSVKRSVWKDKFTNIKVKLFAIIAFRKFGWRGLPLRQLLLADCNLTAESALMIQYVIRDNPYIVDVDLSYNKQMTDRAAEFMAKLILINSTSLLTLKMNGCGLTDWGIQQLIHAACRHKDRETGSQVVDPGRSVSSLQTLEISHNHAGPTALSWIASSTNQFTLDDLKISGGYRNVIDMNATQANNGHDEKGENWDSLWTSAENVAAEIAEFYGGGFNDEDNDFEGDEWNDDETMDDDEAAEHL